MKPEIALRFGAHNTLVGVLTPPENETRDGLAVILLNAGLIHHVGPHRLYVRIARHLAACGVASLRFDFSGIGDSPARADNLPIREMVVAEPIEAMDALAREGYRRFVLAGICSGAYSAFQTARVDPRVAGAILINPQDAEAEGAENHAAWAHRYWHRSLFSGRAWRNLFTGRVDYRRLFDTLAGQLAGKARREVGTSIAKTQAQLSHFLSARSGHLLYLVSDDDLSRDYVSVLLDPRKFPAHPRIAFERVAGADHLFTCRGDQVRLLDFLAHWIRGLPEHPPG